MQMSGEQWPNDSNSNGTCLIAWERWMANTAWSASHHILEDCNSITRSSLASFCWLSSMAIMNSSGWTSVQMELALMLRSTASQSSSKKMSPGPLAGQKRSLCKTTMADLFPTLMWEMTPSPSSFGCKCPTPDQLEDDEED